MILQSHHSNIYRLIFKKKDVYIVFEGKSPAIHSLIMHNNVAYYQPAAMRHIGEKLVIL